MVMRVELGLSGYMMETVMGVWLPEKKLTQLTASEARFLSVPPQWLRVPTPDFESTFIPDSYKRLEKSGKYSFSNETSGDYNSLSPDDLIYCVKTPEFLAIKFVQDKLAEAYADLEEELVGGELATIVPKAYKIACRKLKQEEERIAQL